MWNNRILIVTGSVVVLLALLFFTLPADEQVSFVAKNESYMLYKSNKFVIPTKEEFDGLHETQKDVLLEAFKIEGSSLTEEEKNIVNEIIDEYLDIRRQKWSEQLALQTKYEMPDEYEQCSTKLEETFKELCDENDLQCYFDKLLAHQEKYSCKEKYLIPLLLSGELVEKPSLKMSDKYRQCLAEQEAALNEMCDENDLQCYFDNLPIYQEKYNCKEKYDNSIPYPVDEIMPRPAPEPDTRTIYNISDIIVARDNVFDVTTAKVGDVISGMTLVEIKPRSLSQSLSTQNASMKFAGETKVSGKLQDVLGVFSGVMINLDEESVQGIPRASDQTKKREWVLFTNQDFAKQILDIHGEGNITVVIDAYAFSRYPSSGIATAELVTVVTE